MSTEKNAQLKFENYVLFGEVSEDSSPGGILSVSSEGLLQKGKGGSRIYRTFATISR